MIRLIDISPPMSAASPTFPGDEPFSLRAERSASTEGTVSVSVVTSSVHNGAHVDAPLHVFAEGDDIASLSLECFVGTCFTADLSTSIASWEVPIRFEELPADFFRGCGVHARLLRATAYQDALTFAGRLERAIPYDRPRCGAPSCRCRRSPHWCRCAEHRSRRK